MAVSMDSVGTWCGQSKPHMSGRYCHLYVHVSWSHVVWDHVSCQCDNDPKNNTKACSLEPWALWLCCLDPCCTSESRYQKILVFQ